MEGLLPAFKTVSVMFAVSAVVTGIQAITNPVGFSRFFGLPLDATSINPAVFLQDYDDIKKATAAFHSHQGLTKSYISLMGVRQLATGMTLLTFAYQNKWTEMATILAIIGIIVAGTDGIYLSRAGQKNLGRMHAIPGAVIAALAGAVIYLDS